jgi:hypothetical protein
MNFAKGLAAGLIAAIVIFWLFSKIACNPVHKVQPEDNKTTTSDTGHQVEKGAGKSDPVLTKVTSHQPATGKRDTLWIHDTIPFAAASDPDHCCENYAYALKLCSDTSFYYDKIFLDSTHKSFVVLTDSVTGNSLVGRGYSYQWIYPVITNTTTITKKEKPRLQLLIGGGVAGTKTDPLKLAELNMLLRGKKGGAIGLTVKKELNTGETIYGFTKLWLVSFRRK